LQQKTAWFVQYKDNREIIVVKRNICYLNPFTTTKFFISILKRIKPTLDYSNTNFSIKMHGKNTLSNVICCVLIGQIKLLTPYHDS
jgi:hypothetical protein